MNNGENRRKNGNNRKKRLKIVVMIVNFREQNMDICKIMIILAPCFLKHDILIAQLSVESAPRKRNKSIIYPIGVCALSADFNIRIYRQCRA